MDGKLVTSTGARINVRPASPADEAFLHRLYADRRGPELALLGWPEPARRDFLDMQFRAQQQGYGAAFPDAHHRIVLEGVAPVGRLLVDRRPGEHLVVDIVVLTRCRGQGIGTVLMRAVLAKAAATGVPVRLSASLADPRLVGWYERLGFHVVERGDVDVSMLGGG